jgi:hypothetical protein
MDKKSYWSIIFQISIYITLIYNISYIYSQEDNNIQTDRMKINITDEKLFESLKNYENKYGEYYELKINKCRVTKEEKVLMTIAENYFNDDLFTTNTFKEHLPKPNILCNKVFEYYFDIFYKNVYNSKKYILDESYKNDFIEQYTHMKLEYNVDMKYIGEMLFDNILYKDIYKVYMSLGFEYGSDINTISTEGSGCGFGIQRWVWIQKSTKKIIKVVVSGISSVTWD